MRYAIFAVDTVSLGVGYIISYLRMDGHEVKLFLESFLYPDEKDILRRVSEYNPDACLFSCLTVYYQWALRVSRTIKLQLNCKIIFGGLHVTSCPDVVKENDWIDEICVGCGVKYFGHKLDPDEVLPAREDFYKLLPPHYRAHPYMMTDFGCPYNCTYCLPRELKLQLPRRSIEGCIEECMWLKEHGAKRLFIWDDSFTINREWLAVFLDEYRGSINLPFRCVTHPKLITDDIVHDLKDAGCYLIGIGLQTGNEWMRRNILHRYETNEEFLDACYWIKKYNMALTVDHIFELPFETEETNQQSYELYKQAKPDLINCFKLIYLPKAKIIDYALIEGRLTQKDVYNIEHGIGNNYASGEHYRVAKVNPFVIKMLAIPLGGGVWEHMPDFVTKLMCYVKIGRDWLPQSIIQNHIHFIIQRSILWAKRLFAWCVGKSF